MNSFIGGLAALLVLGVFIAAVARKFIQIGVDRERLRQDKANVDFQKKATDIAAEHRGTSRAADDLQRGKF